MIAACDQCLARFRVPDDKVAEGGVTLRCTQCQNTFRVSRPSAAAPSRTAFSRRKGAAVILGLAAAASLAVGSYRQGSRLLKGVVASRDEWVLTDLSNGLVDTENGKPVFFVRGEVENRRGYRGKVEIRADIMEGAQVIRSAEGVAGAVPTPEELYNVSGGVDADALTAKLNEQAVSLSPGKKIPFLLIFYEYPPQLSDYRFQVVAVPFTPFSSAAAR